MTATQTEEPLLSVLGVTKAHAQRAVRWLRDRSILSCYDPTERSLRAPVTKHGREWTYKAMQDAVEATLRK